MTSLQLPETFLQKIANTVVEPFVSSAMRATADFVGDPTRGMPFFPEYTDHSIRHIQSVLDSAEYLISEDSLDLLTPEDVAVLVVAILLHDLGMHLSEDQFISLMSETSDFPLVARLDSSPWRELWQDYLAEARHWDDSTLFTILGDKSQDDEDLVQVIKPLEESGSPEQWTLRYRKFIGEFIRRHHARLAHEIAVNGVPLTDGSRTTFLSEASAPLRDLAGFVARSHHMPLRETFSYLTSRFHGFVRCANAHPLYLMTVLRIADYVQLENSRAPLTSRRVRTIRNPYSARQWDLHQCIDEVREDDADGQALFVLANPQTAQAFLDVQSLLTDIQRELDNSWATLGEVYSRQPNLQLLGLRLRRIKSNVDDVESFGNTVDYIPRRFQFTSHTRLLQSLVGPLYGNRPEIAIRELLQNAIDAVQERARATVDLQPDNLQSTTVWVRVKKDHDAAWFEIEDRGIGMTEETVHSYFLCAGASFRESSQWRIMFAVGGEPLVTRSGRFGIGALAAFLLGKTIHVTTRHIHAAADHAISFSANINTAPIEIKRSTRPGIGTTIRIPVSEEIYENLVKLDGLEWDWYRWSWPVVEREIDGKTDLPTLTKIPDPGAELPEEWHRVHVDGYDEVLWTFGRAPHMVLNGINVGTSASSYGYSRQFHWEGDAKRMRLDWPFSVPYVSVHDRSARFPVDLPRCTIEHHRFPFSDDLVADITRDFAAFCLVFAPEQHPFVNGRSFRSRIYPGTGTRFGGHFDPGHWFFTLEGSMYISRASLASLDASEATLFVRLSQGDVFPALQLRNREPAFLGAMRPEVYHGEVMFPLGLAEMLCLPIYELSHSPFFFDKAEGAALVLPARLSDRYYVVRNGNVDLSVVERHELPQSGSDPVHIWSIGSVDLDQLDNQTAIKMVAAGGAIYGKLWQPKRASYTRNSSFDKQWLTLFPRGVIPYDMTERRRELAETFECLASYVSKWQALWNAGESEWRRRFFRETKVNERL